MKRETIEGFIRDAFPEAEDAQVSDLLAKVMAENGKDITRYKSIAEKNDGELEELRAKAQEYDEYRASTMTDEQKRKESDEAVERLQRELKTKLNRVEVERMFVTGGIAEEDYEPLLDSIVTEDAKASKQTAERMLEMLSKAKEATEKQVRADLVDSMPKPPSNGSAPKKVTKEQFDSMTYAELSRLYEEDPETYRQLNEGE